MLQRERYRTCFVPALNTRYHTGVSVDATLVRLYISVMYRPVRETSTVSSILPGEERL